MHRYRGHDIHPYRRRDTHRHRRHDLRNAIFGARGFLAAAILLAITGSAFSAAAFVPSADKLATRVAGANRVEGRSQPLMLSVALRGEDDRTLAQGELWTDRRGVARLELSAGGVTERHLVRGGEHLAARDGSMIAGPAPYLPPLFLLQARSGDRLLSGILSNGGAGNETVLGLHEGAVCYVVGGRNLVAPANASAAMVGSVGAKAAVWVQREDSRIVRIDLKDGTRFLLGPSRQHEGVKLPEWIRIERPGVPTARLDILSARVGRFDLAATFGTDWLLGR